MNLKKTLVGVAVATSLGVAAPASQAATLDTLFATGGQFSMGVFTPAPNPITNFGGYNLVGDFPTPIGWDVNAGQTSAHPTSVASFDFNGGGNWVNSFLASSDPQGVDGGGHPAPSGTVGAGASIANGDTIAVDLAAFYANWNGTNFNQGGQATGTVSNVVGDSFDFTMSWSSLIVGGPFDGKTGAWTLTGNGTIVSEVAPVPAPAAVWLFGAGLAGLMGMVRRSRKQASA